jgi:hypothetical protein
MEVTAALSAVDGFLTVNTAYEDDDFSKNRLAKDEAKEAAKIATALVSLRCAILHSNPVLYPSILTFTPILHSCWTKHLKP